MKIAVFGASVSQQTIKHASGEVTGYAEVLRRDHAAALGANEIRQITYGGNRLSDGGLLRLADVLAWQPDICLFEPLIEDGARGQHSREAEKRYVYITLLEAGILPVTLLLPDPFGKAAHELPHYDQFVGISRQYGLPVIEINLEGVTERETKFNGIHTLLEGAQIYARQIVAGLKGLGDPRVLVQSSLARALACGRPTLAVTPLPLSGAAKPEVTSLEVALVLDTPGSLRVRLVQTQRIGTFSPVLDVTLTPPHGPSIRQGQLSVWDPYCHYTRDSFVMLADLVLEQPGQYLLSLKVSDTLPDYALCRHEVADWPKLRYLQPVFPPVLISDRAIEAKITKYEVASA